VWSCAKLEGEGGQATIEGKVYAIDYAKGSLSDLDTFPAVDEDVYIVYGGGNLGDDDTKTIAGGKYQFKYLRKGDYSIYVYSDDPYGSGVDVPSQINISVSKNGDTYKADNIYIYKTKNGASSIIGSVKGVLFTDKENVDVDTVPLVDEDVYIRNLSSEKIDDVKTDYEGVFVIPNLSPGSYEVFFYENDIAVGEKEIKKSILIEVTNVGEVLNAGETILYKSDEGIGKISGSIFITEWFKNESTGLYEQGIPFAGRDEPVYIAPKGKTGIVYRERTNDEGEFMFSHLRAGEYSVYVYSDQKSTGKQVVISKSIEITQSQYTFDVGALEINIYH